MGESGPHRTRGSRGNRADERQGMDAREWLPPHVRCVKCPHINFYFIKTKTSFFFYLSLATWEGGSRQVIMSHTYAYHMAHPPPLPTTINQNTIYQPSLPFPLPSYFLILYSIHVLLPCWFFFILYFISKRINSMCLIHESYHALQNLKLLSTTSIQKATINLLCSAY